MSTREYIPVVHLCEHYKIQQSFITELHDKGVVKIVEVEQTVCVHHESIPIVEKIVRIHNDLNVNVEGIDVILNLLERLETINRELVITQNRLRLYE